MTNANNTRKSAVAALAIGVVLFSLTGLDSSLKPTNYAASAAPQTTAQA